jgi:putative ABC transport system substrate-binding protein
MRRRDLLVSAAFLIVGAAPPMAQTSGKTARIGILLQVPPSAAAVQPLWKAIVDGLREHGWEEGRNLIIEGRFAGQNPERFHDLAAELVALPVDVILAANAQSIEAARRRTATIPIVMTGQAASPGEY